MGRQIILSVKRETWRQADENVVPIDEEFKRMRKSRLQMDDHTCQFCDWRSTTHQDVHHVNDSHDDNSLDNLVTACNLCHACHHIGFASLDGAGVMILMTDVTQATLNKLMRALYAINAVGTDAQKQFGAMLWKMLMARAKPVREAWGTSNPTVFADKLLMLPSETYNRRGDTFMNPLRIVFTPNSPMIKPVMPTWMSHFGKVPSDMWMQVCEDVMGRLTEARNREMERLGSECLVAD